MPRRGGGRNNRNWKTDGDHFEHDDRSHSSNMRRVSFKPGTSKGKNKFRTWNDANLLLDDDIDMGANAGQGQGQGYNGPRKGPYRGRGGRITPALRRPGGPRKFIAGMLPWYQIIIPHGVKHPKDVILKALLGFISPDIFIPHYYKINGNAAIFYVDDVKVAEKLFNADRKIVMSDGFKLVVMVRNSVPNVVIDEDMKTSMKLVMAKRYNVTTKALDLTKFHADPDLADLFCALFRPPIMLAAIDIIAENIPDLEALNLNDNKLHGIDHLKVLSSKLKSLKILYMGDNRTWRDLKKKARDEGARARYARGVTGNDTIVPKISEISEIILGTIGRESAEGIGAVGETVIGGAVSVEEPWVAEQALDQPSTSALIEADPPGPSSSTPRRLPAAPRRKRTRIPSREGPMTKYLAIMQRQMMLLEIPYVSSMDPLRTLPLVELYLKGNPLVNRCSDHDIYVSDVRKKFPKLVRLDGVDLPPAIGFDVAEDAALPPRIQSFLVNEAGKGLVRDFLTQYYAIYDSESRQPLLDAYHEHASMSMAASYLSYDGRNTTGTKLSAYITNSRNILRITERDSRRRYLRMGRLQVVSFLSDLPRTTHDLMGFTVDLPVFIPTMIVLVMNGVYKETSVAGSPTRSFHRTFVIVPNATGGFSIMNDMLFVTNTTKEQEDQAFTTGVPAAPEPPAAAVAAPAPAAAPTVDDQAALINMLRQQTGMNHHWSMNCLLETGWDPQRAVLVFNRLQSEGKIPPEAFAQ